MDVDIDVRRPITVLIAVAVRLYRDGLAMTLGAHPSLSVVGAIGTPQDALVAVRASQPDVVIVDATLEGALDLMRAIRQASPGGHILAFAVREDLTVILECAEAGADGFFTTNGCVPDLIQAIERTAAGELLCSPRIAAELLRRAAHRTPRPGVPGAEVGLTIRENQVFGLLRQGRSNKEIAGSLHIAEATVKNHVHRVLEKLHVATRAEAIASISRHM